MSLSSSSPRENSSNGGRALGYRLSRQSVAYGQSTTTFAVQLSKARGGDRCRQAGTRAYYTKFMPKEQLHTYSHWKQKRVGGELVTQKRNDILQKYGLWKRARSSVSVQEDGACCSNSHKPIRTENGAELVELSRETYLQRLW